MNRSLFVIILLLFNSLAFGQAPIDRNNSEKNFQSTSWHLPSEIKYGSLFRESKYNSQYYISILPVGYELKKPHNHLFIAGGISYTYMFSKNYLSVYPYIGETHGTGIHYGVKIEPMINLESGNYEYTNIEVIVGFLLSTSLTIGIPYNHQTNPFYIGFKVGLGFPQPNFIFR